MKSLKQFLEKKKSAARFKRAGPGQQLGSSAARSTSSGAGTSDSSRIRTTESGVVERKPLSSGSEKAAAAALARSNQKKQQADHTQRQLEWIRQQARKELEEEKAATTAAEASSSGTGSGAHPADTSGNYTVPGVFYTCPFVGPEVLPRPEIEARLRDMLFDQLEDERAIASCLIIKTCNRNAEMSEAGVSVLCRYLDNIVQNPSDSKYRRIRCANRVYQQRVAPLCGADHFMRAVGFHIVREQPTVQDGGQARSSGQDGDQAGSSGPDGGQAGSSGQDGGQAGSSGQDGGELLDDSCVWQLDDDFDPEYLQTLRDALVDAEPIVPELDRNVRVLIPAQSTARVQLPPDFFNITVRDLQREEKQRRDLVDDLSMLQTKAMREKARARDTTQYRYCLIRIRFPDNFSLQGTFRCLERVSAVFAFVREHMANSEEQFSLLAPSGVKLSSHDSSTLIEAQLVPSIVLIWSSENNKEGATRDGPYIKQEFLTLAGEL